MTSASTEPRGHVVRIDASGRANEADAGSGGGIGNGLQPLRLQAVRRTSQPHLPDTDQQQQEQYHHHHDRRSFLQQQMSGANGSDEEMGSGKPLSANTPTGGRRQPGTPNTPGTTRRNSRLATLSMLLLVFQGTTLSIMLRYSRARAGAPYLASVSVAFTEIIKLCICIAVQLHICYSDVRAATAGGGGGSGSGGASAEQRRSMLWVEVQRQARDIASKSYPMLLPAGMFVFQQILLVVAASHLDAVAFQIFSQSFKLVPTALFAYWLLGQTLEPMQWCSIPVLAAGVILVTVNNGSGSSGQSAAAAAVSSSSKGLDYVAGMVACSVSGLSSAYAGVYFEKYVKGKHAASLWVRNIQLGLYGVPFSVVYTLIKDGSRIRAAGLMQGFDNATWAVVWLQIFGGLVTGMVVKYCDNILKNFALAISVILTVLVAIPLFGQWPSTFFLLGVSLVLLSVFMYGRALNTRHFALWVQWAQKRMRMEDSRRIRVLLLAMLLAVAMGGVMLASSLAKTHRIAGLPMRQVSEAGLAQQLAELGGGTRQRQQGGGGGGGSGGRDGGLRRNFGQALREGAVQQQLIADGGRKSD